MATTARTAVHAGLAAAAERMGDAVRAGGDIGMAKLVPESVRILSLLDVNSLADELWGARAFENGRAN